MRVRLGIETNIFFGGNNMDCICVYYGNECVDQNGKVFTDTFVDLGEKFIFTVFPSEICFSIINPNFKDNKGNSMSFQFSKHQISVTKRVIEEGFIFKRIFYILDITISYPNLGETRNRNSIKVDKRNGDNILTILGFS